MLESPRVSRSQTRRSSLMNLSSILVVSLLFMTTTSLQSADGFSSITTTTSQGLKPRHFVGFDLGTSGCRISVISDNLTESQSTSSPSTSPDFYPEVYTNAIPWDANNTGAYDDPNAWLKAIETLLKGATESLPTGLNSVTSICISGTSASCVLVDRSNAGAFTRRSRMYNYNVVESHPKKNRLYGLKALEVLEQFAPPHHTALSATGSLAKLLAWQMEKPLQSNEVLAHQADYVVSKFLGNAKACGGGPKNYVQIVSDWHNCLKLGYDVQQLQWPDWMHSCLRAAGIPNPGSVLPSRVVSPGKVIGTISKDAAARFGLSPNTKIVGGTTDSNSAFVAAIGSLDAPLGTAVTSLGSTLAIKFLSETYVENVDLGVYSHRFPDISTTAASNTDEEKNINANSLQWLVGGASNVGCAILRQEQFSNDELDELSLLIDPSTDSPLMYYPLTKKGERFPIADGSKEPIIEPKPDSRVEYLHAILQGISSVERDGFLVLGQCGASPTFPYQILTSGGGSRSKMWSQMRERRLREAFQTNEIKVATAQNVEASYGAAILAAASFS